MSGRRRQSRSGSRSSARRPSSRGPSPRRPIVLGSAVLVLALAGLGYLLLAEEDIGTNGVAQREPAAIVAAAQRRADAASSVRLHGTIVSDGAGWQLDMRMGASSAKGKVSFEGRTFELLRIGKDLYLKANKEMYRQDEDGRAGAGAAATGKPKPDPAASAGADAVEALEGKFVEVPKDDPLYDRLSRFTEKSAMLNGLFVLHGAKEKAGTKRVNGRNTVTVQARQGRGGSLQVAVDGKPYPLQYRRAGGTGVLSLEEYGRPVEVAAPPKDQIIDYRKYVRSAP